MPDKIRWGIMSTASIARGRFIPAIRESQKGIVTAVASRSLEKAQAFAGQMNIPKAYGSYQELIADPEIDAIYIATPNSEHAVWSIRCAEAGKPTLCEKPLASNASEAQHMVDAFAQRGVPFMEGFMYRFHPQTQRVKAMIDGGAVGDVRVIDAKFTFTAQREEEVALSKALAGGSLMDVGCYCVNVMRYMAGEEPDHMLATAQWGERTQVDEALVGILTFPSGIVGHFDSGLRTYQTHVYDIRGTRGRIAVETAFDIEPDHDTTIRYWHGGRYEEITIPAANHFTIMADDFADALLNGRAPRFPPQDAVNNMRIIDRLYAAVRNIDKADS